MWCTLIYHTLVFFLNHHMQHFNLRLVGDFLEQHQVLSREKQDWLLEYRKQGLDRWWMSLTYQITISLPIMLSCLTPDKTGALQRDEAVDSLSFVSLLPSSKTLRNAEPLCVSRLKWIIILQEMLILLTMLLLEDLGWYAIGTMGFLSQEMFKPLRNFSTSLDQSSTRGDLICSRLEAVTLWNEC